MRGLIVIGALALVVGGAAYLTMLEERGQGDGDKMAMRRVNVIEGEGFRAKAPPDYLVIDDPRMTVPVGAVALGREQGPKRATIMLTPYPEHSDQLYTEVGCDTVARLHAKQIGAQLRGSNIGGRDTAFCQAALNESSDFEGLMVLRKVAATSIMVTCRFPKGSQRDGQACMEAAASLAAR